MIDLQDYAGSVEQSVFDAGRYEMVISASVKKTKDNTSDYLNLSFKIREDVTQKNNDGYSYVFKKVFRDKENPKWFDLAEIGAILMTQKNREDFHTNFEEVDEFIQYINGSAIAVDVEKIYDEYYAREVNRINFAYRKNEQGKNIIWKNPYHASLAGPYTAPVKEEKPATAAPAVEEVAPGVKGTNLDKLNIDPSEFPF